MLIVCTLTPCVKPTDSTLPLSSFFVSSPLPMQNQVKAGVCLSEEMIRDALDKLRGAVTIVYPMNLPPYDPVRLEFEGNEDLAGTQVKCV